LTSFWDLIVYSFFQHSCWSMHDVLLCVAIVHIQHTKKFYLYMESRPGKRSQKCILSLSMNMKHESDTMKLHWLKELFRCP
jgi:hypothetical protein